MQYTNESIENIIDGFEKFKEHVAAVMHMAGKGTDDIESFDGIWGGNLRLTTSSHGRCGYETENHEIPLEWLTSEDPEVLKEKIEAKRAEERRIAEERRQQERIITEARQTAADLATLARLKSKYEPTTNGETP